jgi:hypothetical protein
VFAAQLLPLVWWHDLHRGFKSITQPWFFQIRLFIAAMDLLQLDLWSLTFFTGLSYSKVPVTIRVFSWHMSRRVATA